jgi:putative ABC transport system substrate-binding protein
VAAGRRVAVRDAPRRRAHGRTRRSEGQARLAVIRRALKDLGWEENRNLRLTLRWAAGGDQQHIQASATELVALAPEVILANSTPAIAALTKATRTIPVVMAQAVDPVGLGYVQSLARPGGNITGFTYVDLDLVAKWLEMLKEAAPSVTRAALLFNPDNTPFYFGFLRDLEGRGGVRGVVLSAAPVRSVPEMEAAVDAIARERGGGLILPPNPFIGSNRKCIAALAVHHRLPSVSVYRQYTVEGGLMSYGPNSPDIFRRAAGYMDRILRGARPAELPVQAPSTYEMTLNAKTAQALGITLPTTIVASADEVIE